jgi:feruloyl esterase
MFHCRGGDAPNSFDMLSAMVDWVEKGEAPHRVVATQYDENQNVKRTRPLYAYPDYAQYRGTGDVNDAANWTWATPKTVTDDRVDWIWAPAS